MSHCLSGRPGGLPLRGQHHRNVARAPDRIQEMRIAEKPEIGVFERRSRNDQRVVEASSGVDAEYLHGPGLVEVVLVPTASELAAQKVTDTLEVVFVDLGAGRLVGHRSNRRGRGRSAFWARLSLEPPATSSVMGTSIMAGVRMQRACRRHHGERPLDQQRVRVKWLPLQPQRRVVSG